MAGPLNMSNNKITHLANPTANGNAINNSWSESSAVARPNGQPRQAGVARGVRGHAPPPPPREILNFSLSEMRFAAFSGPFGNFFSS